jgi:hypothetical protein
VTGTEPLATDVSGLLSEKHGSNALDEPEYIHDRRPRAGRLGFFLAGEFGLMTAYQAMLAKEAMILSKMVAEIVEGPVVLLNIGLKKALTGEEIALPSEDVAELERRFQAIKVELRATGELEEFFARRVASMTVRVERAVG